MLFNECQHFLICIAILKTVQSKKDMVKEDVTRAIYEFEKKWLSLLKDIEQMTKDCTVKEVQI